MSDQISLYKYEFYCESGCGWLHAWDEEDAVMDACPNNPAHTIDPESIAIVDQVINEGPTMADGRPIVRSDTRPLSTSTYFTMEGDATNGIGGGTKMVWDFSNSDNDYTGDDVPSSMKAKKISLTFNDPTYLKDGTIYFFDAPWGSYLHMYIEVPAGNYYPNPFGAIPSAALGLPEGQMYSYADVDIKYASFLNYHRMYTSCAMGDEINAEGSQVDPTPVGWRLVGKVFTLEDNVIFKGFGAFEMYRARTALLPGDPLGD